MNKFMIEVPVDYVSGYLRYGHKEMTIEADSKEEAMEKATELIESGKFKDCSDIVVDEYYIDDCGNLNYKDMQIYEI